MGLPKERLPVLEQFTSIQGEGRNLGMPYVFIRVGGCPLRCRFCDSEYTWKVKKDSICLTRDVAWWALNAADRVGTNWISITGGEPLLYPEQLKDMMAFWRKQSNARIKVHIETSGRFFIEDVHRMSDMFSMDIKTPCTNEVRGSDMDNLRHMRACDQVKCLIEDEADMDYARVVHKELDGKCPLILQPFNTNVDEVCDPEVDKAYVLLEKYRWIVDHVLHDTTRYKWSNVMITPQVHVLIFGNVPAT